MQYYERIDISKGVGVNKTSRTKEWDICHYWYVLDKGFNSKPRVCNGCLDLLKIHMNFSNIAILNIEGADCRCIISRIRKSDAIN